MIYLLLFIHSMGQVILTCNQQSDCYIGDYCSLYNMCYDCSYISPSDCDALNSDCCSESFLKQCSTNPYQCSIVLPTNPQKHNNNIMNPYLRMFLIIFSVFSVSYLSVGTYYNKYVKEKKGYDIFPNKDCWIHFRGLVRDGVSYSYELVMNRMGYESI